MPDVTDWTPDPTAGSASFRYEARTDNIEHSCCYEATVVDTTVLTSYGKYPEIIAECSTLADAQLIAATLNRSLTE